jgi:hypothetical protein
MNITFFRKWLRDPNTPGVGGITNNITNNGVLWVKGTYLPLAAAYRRKTKPYVVVSELANNHIPNFAEEMARAAKGWGPVFVVGKWPQNFRPSAVRPRLERVVERVLDFSGKSASERNKALKEAKKIVEQANKFAEFFDYHWRINLADKLHKAHQRAIEDELRAAASKAKKKWKRCDPHGEANVDMYIEYMTRDDA